MLERISIIEYRKNIVLAQIGALVGNIGGGKGKGRMPNPAKDFGLMDFLPSFALPKDMQKDGHTDIQLDYETAKIMLKLSRAQKLAPFVHGLKIIPAARRVLGADADKLGV